MFDLRYFFFFSSRRRHTRSLCDWSSDVCSSDLSNRCAVRARLSVASAALKWKSSAASARAWQSLSRSEEHTSELQSHSDLVCRLLLEKKKKKKNKRMQDRKHKKKA